MAKCMICGEVLPEHSQTCSICGSRQPENPAGLRVATVVTAPETPALRPLTSPEPLPPNSRLCPGCGKVVGPEYADAFCECGMELVMIAPMALEEPNLPPRDPSRPNKPAPGTPCLVLYGADKTPIRYFPLTKDALLIGRLDAVAGNFPEIDVTEWLDAASARKVSRKHALILRSRQSAGFTIRPLAGNTGTQIEADMVPALSDFPLTPGQRLILGGAVRLKFEIS